MGRLQKPHVNFNCKLDKNISDNIKAIAEENHITQTAIVERALEKYINEYQETKII